MARPKTSKTQRPRPDVYQQALTAARKRIERALVEKAECESQLARLNEEIPRLQRIIDVFEPETKTIVDKPDARSLMRQPAVSEMDIKSYEAVVKQGLLPVPSPEALKRVPDHLKRFIQPSITEATAVAIDDNNPDRYLPDVE